MKEGWEEPYGAVCDNVEMAEFFIEKAREGGLSRRWSLNIAAGALWSAFDIYNKKVLCEEARLARSATAWFKLTEPLVGEIRNGAVHFDQPQGVGMEYAPGRPKPSTSLFVWLKKSDGGVVQLSLDEVLGRLGAAATLMRRCAFEETTGWYIPLG